MSYKPSVPFVAAYSQNTTNDTSIPLMTTNLAVSTGTGDGAFQFKTAGLLKYMKLSMAVNGAGSSTIVSIRKNGVDTSLSITVPAATTGIYTDYTNEVTVDVDDEMEFYVDRGSLSSFSHLSVDFSTNGKCVSILGNSILTTLSTASVTRFYSLVNSSLEAVTTHDSRVGMRVEAPITAKNLMVRINSNARTTTTTFRFVNNPGVNGNQVISVGSGLTGDFWDTTNSDVLVVDDLPCFSVTTGSGTQQIRWTVMKVDLVSEPYHYTAYVRDINSNLSPTNTRYFNLFASNTIVQTESFVQYKIRSDGLFKNLRCFVRTNTKASTSTITLRINSTNTSITVSIPAATTGTFTDLTNTEIFRVGDEVNYSFVPGGAGNFTLSYISLAIFQNSGRRGTMITI